MIAFVKPPGTSGVRSADELLAEFRATGAAAPFEELVRRYAAMVFSECYSVTKSKHDAEDAAQATFLTLAIQARTGDEIRHLGPWLQRVARRVALDQEKAKRRRKRREDNHHRVNGSTGMATAEKLSLDQLELRHLINEELQQLPAKYRMPLILHYFGGLSRDQMAAELKVKPATLGVRLFRARDMLGKRLSKRGIALPAVALPIGIAMVVRESVEQHGVLAMAASASQIAEAANRVACGLTPVVGSVSPSAMMLAQSAVNDLVLRRVRTIIAAAAIGASALVAGGAQVVQKIQSGAISIQSLFDFSGYFRSLSSPALPEFRVDASQRLDFGQPVPNNWPAGIALPSDGSLELATILIPKQEIRPAPFADVTPKSRSVTIETLSATSTQRTVNAQPAFSSTPHTQSNVGPALASTIESPTYPQTSSISVPSGKSDGASSTGSGSGAFYYDTHFNGDLYVAPASQSAVFVLKPVAPLTSLSNTTTGGTIAGLASSAVTGTTSNYTSYDSVAVTPGAPIPDTGSTVPVVAQTQISSEGNVLRGWGKPAINGGFDMSGVVVADGYAQARTLDLTTVTNIFNSVPNPPNGINGWYAQHRGKLTLPAISIPAGTSTSIWGDTANDGGHQDLVNSVQITLTNAPSASLVTISLLAPDRAEVPQFPSGYEPLTIWSLSAEPALSVSSLGFVARYSLPGSDLAAALKGLSLFYFDGQEWKSASSSIDLARRLISAEDVPASSLFALLTVDDGKRVSLDAVCDPVVLGTNGMLLGYASEPYFAGHRLSAEAAKVVASASAPVTSVTGIPEPSSLGLLLTGLPLIMRRRRR